MRTVERPQAPPRGGSRRGLAVRSRKLSGSEIWRRGWESNPRVKVLQTSPLPLGYRAQESSGWLLVASGKLEKQRRFFSRHFPLRTCHLASWSGRRDLNPRLRPWQGRTLPLSYSRPPAKKIYFPCCGIIRTAASRCQVRPRAELFRLNGPTGGFCPDLQISTRWRKGVDSK